MDNRAYMDWKRASIRRLIFVSLVRDIIPYISTRWQSTSSSRVACTRLYYSLPLVLGSFSTLTASNMKFVSNSVPASTRRPCYFEKVLTKV